MKPAIFSIAAYAAKMMTMPVGTRFELHGQEVGRIHDNHISYRAKGYKDGTEFDPTTRLSGMPERAAIGG